METDIIDGLRWLRGKLLPLTLALVSLFIGGCGHSPLGPFDRTTLFNTPAPPSLAALHAPVFLVRDAEKSFNRIGTPQVVTDSDGEPLVLVDAKQPTIFFEAQEFTTARGSYTNLVYRIHFEEVPLSLTSPNLTGGRNPGLLFIYTLDESGRLLLVTTVHSCGCYLAFLPTSAMPRDFLPADWSAEPQMVYGYSLPSLLHLPEGQENNRIAFTLEDETHRISGVTIGDDIFLGTGVGQVPVQLRPMLDLFSLPYQDRTLSFFETEGARKGYVRNNTKILERIFISWWAFDLHVGEDKAYSVNDTSDTVFYTSLKFWARSASDLKNFRDFLQYWGWRL